MWSPLSPLVLLSRYYGVLQAYGALQKVGVRDTPAFLQCDRTSFHSTSNHWFLNPHAVDRCPRIVGSCELVTVVHWSSKGDCLDAPLATKWQIKLRCLHFLSTHDSDDPGKIGSYSYTTRVFTSSIPFSCFLTVPFLVCSSTARLRSRARLWPCCARGCSPCTASPPLPPSFWPLPTGCWGSTRKTLQQ
jgi:hypothetical protein